MVVCRGFNCILLRNVELSPAAKTEPEIVKLLIDTFVVISVSAFKSPLNSTVYWGLDKTKHKFKLRKIYRIKNNFT